jgi:allantoicase
MSQVTTGPAFGGLVDLVGELVGGQVLAASDDFFAAKEGLIKAAPAVFLPDAYTEQGKWMDGWESRRRRDGGHDWVVLRLGVPGIVRGVDVDTSHFLGNAPAEATVWVLSSPAGDPPGPPAAWPWQKLVRRSPLRPGCSNILFAEMEMLVTHLRLEVFPDGGVARLRAWGEPRPELPRGELADLAALAHGGRTVACSDMFFGRMEQLIYPGRPANMGGGWETRRRRGPGHDWIIVRLATLAVPERIEIDTTHFKGNYPDRCSLDACRAGRELGTLGPLTWERAKWWPLVEETRLGPDQTHVLTDLASHAACDHVRLNIFPDGGVARLRVYARPGDPEEEEG